MDTLTQAQLRALETGGNLSLKRYLAWYKLDDYSLQQRYQTPACVFYRKKLKELAEQGVSKDGGQCLDFTTFADRPSFEEGR